MGMIKYFCLMSVVLVFGLVGWSAWEWKQWPVDYSQFKAEPLHLPYYDPSFRERINPKYFVNATVIRDEDKLRNPEDIAVANDGTIYTALHDNTIAKINSTGGIETLTTINNSGLMLGIILTQDQKTLFVMTEHQGLVKVDVASGNYVSLFKQVEGKQTVSLNQLCLDEQNQILYLTQPGPISMVYSGKQVMLKHKQGKILSYDLKTNQLTVIKRNIAFPNGIVYEASKQAVIYSEITQHRLIRLFVDGPKKGQSEMVLQNFWGFLDNLKWDEQGHLLSGVPGVRNDAFEYIGPRPWIRQALIYLPDRLIMATSQKVAGGVRIDVNSGKVIEEMFGAPVKTHFVTTVLEKNGKRYFASLKNPTIVVMDIGDNSQAQQIKQTNGGDL